LRSFSLIWIFVVRQENDASTRNENDYFVAFTVPNPVRYDVEQKWTISKCIEQFEMCSFALLQQIEILPERKKIMASPDGVEAMGRRRQTKFADALVDEDSEENVKVCIRVRPFNSRELELQRQQTDKPLRSVVAMPDGMAGKVAFYEKSAGSSQEYKLSDEFQYTKTFWSIPEEQQPHVFAPVNQEDVYESLGRPMVKYAVAGFHNCVFAYGQTGSGKTHTMMGDFHGHMTQQAGLIPRLCVELFEKVDSLRREKKEGIIATAEVKLTAIEIYNEQVRDLLWKLTPGRTKNQSLKVRKHPADGSFFVDQLTVVAPESWLDCLRHIEKAVAERTVASTDMNDESSRSHCIFQLILEQTETVHIVSDDPDERYTKPVTNKKVSKINLVDLAGSERLKKSNAQGQQLKEAAGINLSLTTLKKVIDALVQNSKEINPKKHVLIPFRESALTLLLADSLGGNSKTTMIACVSPHYDNQEETLLTLRYANRTGTIVNHARVNEDSAAKQALRLKHEILELQRRLAEGPIDEEADDLQDQLELGRQSLKEMEEANRRVAETADSLRRQAKQEEEARMSSAFYNSMKMALLQQQREQLEVSAVEMEDRIRSNKEESSALTTAIKDHEDSERLQLKQLDRLRKESQAMRIKELDQERQNSKLSHESHENHRKLEKEMEMRYAQKMINSYRLKKENERTRGELDALALEQEQKLTVVISEAAEQYELQVRQFADAETIVQQRTSKIEKEIFQLNLKREECETEAAQLMQNIRDTERRHVETIHSIEREWKDRYQVLKEDYEKNILDMDDAFYSAQKHRDTNLESIPRDSTTEQEDAIKELEKEVQKAETYWNKRVTDLVEEKADDMDLLMREQRELHAVAAARKRKEYENRIGDLVAQLQGIQSVEREVEECITYLEQSVAPLMHLHDTISSNGNSGPAGHYGDRDSTSFLASRYQGYSPEYIDFRRRLVRFDGAVASVKPIAVDAFRDPAQNAMTQLLSPWRTRRSGDDDPLGPVFPSTPVGRVKLSKTTYADAQANLVAAMEQSSRKTQEPMVSQSPLFRRASNLVSRPSFSSPSASNKANSSMSPTPLTPGFSFRR
jgi:hypothetical protein